MTSIKESYKQLDEQKSLIKEQVNKIRDKLNILHLTDDEIINICLLEKLEKSEESINFKKNAKEKLNKYYKLKERIK